MRDQVLNQDVPGHPGGEKLRLRERNKVRAVRCSLSSQSVLVRTIPSKPFATPLLPLWWRS